MSFLNYVRLVYLLEFQVRSNFPLCLARCHTSCSYRCMSSWSGLRAIGPDMGVREMGTYIS